MKSNKTTNVVSNDGDRVIQRIKVKLGSKTSAESRKTTEQQGGSVTFRGAKEPKVEVVDSEHIEAKDENVSGRYGG